jgi:hypothetical protein
VSQPRSFARGSESYRRRTPAKLVTGKIFLVVTEGKNTEPNYLKALRDRFQLAVENVEIHHPNGTDPITLTTKAIELRDERKKQAKKGNGVAYDEVWVVFDLEKPNDVRHKQALQAKAIKEANNIRFAISDPCFEYWLLLHETYTTAQLADCGAAMTRFEAIWPDYSKGSWIPPLEFLNKLPDAVTHSERCREYHKNTDGDGNPSTDMDWLTRSLNDATREHLRLLPED